MQLRAIQHMPEPPYLLEADTRQIALGAIVEICSRKGWLLSAAHVRTNHIDVVATANRPPEQVMIALKAYCSSKLNLRDGNTGQNRWARHGSTRYLWTDVAIRAAIDYVVHQEGEPMPVFEATASTVPNTETEP
jgi:REP element-mobilizing transposase RayT